MVKAVFTKLMPSHFLWFCNIDANVLHVYVYIFVGLLQAIFIYCCHFVQGLKHIVYGECLKSQDI